jgi:hypothetical protein
MANMFPWIAAVLLGALIPALIVAGMSADIRILPFVFAVTLVHAIILGLPVALLYRAKQWTRLSAVLVGAFLIGAIPLGILTLPLDSYLRGVAEAEGVPPTVGLAGWLVALRPAATFGAFGTVGGFVFWLTLRRCGLLTLSEDAAASPTPKRSRIGLVLAGAALVASAAVAAIPSITMDRSCHNMFRDGRRSMSPSVNIDLDIAMDDWPRLTKLLEEFATSHGMSFRNLSKSESSVKILSLSECTASGIVISTNEQRWAHQNFAPPLLGYGVSIGVFDPNYDSYWLALAQELVAKLETEWAGKVRFRGGNGRIVPKPPQLMPQKPSSPARQ